MRIRAVPSIKFTLDNTIAYSIRIAEILNGLIKTDASEAWPEEGQLHQKEEEE
jgi:hypothetical protein